MPPSPHLLYASIFVLRRHVVGLPQGNVELAIGANAADPQMMACALPVRNELALRNDDLGPDGRVDVNRLGAGKSENPIDFGDVKRSVLGETHSVWRIHSSRRSKFGYFTPCPRARLDAHRINLRACCSDENNLALRSDRHVPRAGNQSKEADLEPGRELDPFESLFDFLGLMNKCACVPGPNDGVGDRQGHQN